MGKYEIVLDTETTGFMPVSRDGTGTDKIVEIGAIELFDRKPTGKIYHVYIDPQREVPQEAEAIHGFNRENLIIASGGKTFSDIADEFLDFVRGKTLIIHNAPFDMGFLDAELSMAGKESLSSQCTVFDTLKYANNIYPGRRNNLDALCRRLNVDNSNRSLHGALLDSQILTEVYLSMTQNQNTLEFSVDEEVKNFVGKEALNFKPVVESGIFELPVIEPTSEERIEHKNIEKRIIKQSKDNLMWPQM